MSSIAPLNKIDTDVSFISVMDAQEDSSPFRLMTKYSIQFKTEKAFERFKKEAFPEQWGKYVTFYSYSHPSNRHLDVYAVKKSYFDADDFAYELGKAFPDSNWKKIENFILKVDPSKLTSM